MGGLKIMVYNLLPYSGVPITTLALTTNPHIGSSTFGKVRYVLGG